MTDVTVGIDIGTTAVKAVAADGDGAVLARARVPHDLVVPAPDRLEHRPDQAWRAGVRQALAEVVAGSSDGATGATGAMGGTDATGSAGAAGRPVRIAAVNVAAMVPSLCAVGADGTARTPGLVYGDARARGTAGRADPSQSGELVSFLRWCVAHAPDAAGYWPAQAVANHALGGEAVIDTVTAMTAVPLFDLTNWDPEVAAAAGTSVDRLPRIVPGAEPAGHVLEGTPGGGALLGAGTVDAFAEQLVAGADHDGDVLVICGGTLITWAVLPAWREVDGLWTVPHSVPGKALIGGPSNAGGLFLDRVRRLTGGGPDPVGPPAGPAPDPRRVPVWAPYIRGERTPLHDPHRRAALHDVDLTHDAAAVRRAGYEAAGFVVRHHLDLAGVVARRLVATGGGARSRPWVQALADAVGVPVDVVAVPEGAALGAAFTARVVAGLEGSVTDARRWARTSHRVDPDPAWAEAVAERYARFRAITDRG